MAKSGFVHSDDNLKLDLHLVGKEVITVFGLQSCAGILKHLVHSFGRPFQLLLGYIEEEEEDDLY